MKSHKSEGLSRDFMDVQAVVRYDWFLLGHKVRTKNMSVPQVLYEAELAKAGHVPSDWNGGSRGVGRGVHAWIISDWALPEDAGPTGLKISIGLGNLQ